MKTCSLIIVATGIPIHNESKGKTKLVLNNNMILQRKYG